MMKPGTTCGPLCSSAVFHVEALLLYSIHVYHVLMQTNMERHSPQAFGVPVILVIMARYPHDWRKLLGM
jgi:hypothetical protein